MAAVGVRLPNLRDGFDNDVSIYLTGGFAWLAGDLPYRDLFDHKGPLNSELFAALDWLLPHTTLALRIAILAVVCLSLVQLSALLGRHAPRAAWPAVVIYAIAVSSPLFQGQDPNTEQWALPLGICAADLADRARFQPLRGRALGLAAAAGAAVVAAAALKSVYLLAAAPLPLALLAGRPKLLATAAAGGVLTGALILVPFALQGTLGDLGDAVVGYSADFARSNLAEVAGAGARGVLDYLTTFPSLLLAVAAGVLGAVAWTDPRRRRLVAAAMLAVAGGWLTALLPGRSYVHYFLLCLPGLAVLCGAGIEALADRFATHRRAAVLTLVAPFVLVLAIVPIHTALTIPEQSRWGIDTLPCVGIQAQAAGVVARLTAPEDRIYVATGSGASYFGQQIYWQSRRLPASRFIFPRDVVPPAYAEVAADLRATPPDAIVLMPDPILDPVQQALRDGDFKPVANIDCGAGNSIRVLVRSAPAERITPSRASIASEG